jgi:hypothetical protein
MTRINAFPPAKPKAKSPRGRQDKPQPHKIRVLPRPSFFSLRRNVSCPRTQSLELALLTLLLRTIPPSKSSDCETAVIDLISSEKSPSWSPKKLCIISVREFNREEWRYIPPVHDTEPPHILRIQILCVILRFPPVRRLQLTPRYIQSFRTRSREIISISHYQQNNTPNQPANKRNNGYILPTNRTLLSSPSIQRQNLIFNHKCVFLAIGFTQR